MVILCAAAAAFKAHRPTNDAKWLKDYVKTPVATTEQVTRVQMKKNRAWKAHASKGANGVGDEQNTVEIADVLNISVHKVGKVKISVKVGQWRYHAPLRVLVCW